MSPGKEEARPAQNFTLEPRDGYLYMKLDTGFELTPATTARIWNAMSDACKRHNLRRVLVEAEELKRRLTPMESFDHAGLASRLMPGLMVACCFHGFVPDEQSSFFRTAAMNRGVRAEFFQDLDAAIRWLGAGK